MAFTLTDIFASLKAAGWAVGTVVVADGKSTAIIGVSDSAGGTVGITGSVNNGDGTVVSFSQPVTVPPAG